MSATMTTPMPTYPPMTEGKACARSTVVHHERIVGWVSLGGCENDACLRATDKGRPWHATPWAGGMTEYHYHSRREGELAVIAASRRSVFK